MRDAAAATLTVEVKVPKDALRHHPWEPEAIAEQMRILWLLEQVRGRRLGYGKAAQLAGLPVAAFVRLMGEHRISPFDFDPGELDEELAVTP